jgi:hypothetical protein
MNVFEPEFLILTEKDLCDYSYKQKQHKISINNLLTKTVNMILLSMEGGERWIHADLKDCYFGW